MLKFRYYVCTMLIIALFLTSIAVSADNGSYNQNINDFGSEEIGILSAVGIPLSDDSLQDNDITKGEFVSYAVYLLGYGGETMNVNMPYSDMYRGHAYSSQIGFAYSMGMFENDWEKLYPDDKLTKYFAETVMFNALGYKNISTASAAKKARAKITKGVNTVGTTVLDRINALKVLYNCIDIPMAEQNSYTNGNADYTVSGTTLIQKYLNITKVSGRVTSTPSASADGTRSAAGHIAIDGTDYIYSGDTDAVFAMYVDAFVSDIGGKNTVVGIAADKSTKIIKIDSDDFVSYSGNSVKYFDSSKSKTQSVSSPIIVYNGADVSGSDYNKKLFDIKCGSVTLIADKSGVYDIIRIDSYKDIFIGSSDTDNKYIVSEDGEKISYANADYGGFYMYNSDGTEKSEPGSVGRGMFATVRQSVNGEHTDVYVSSNVITSPAAAIKYESGRIKCVTLSDGKVYSVSRGACIDKIVVNTTDTYDFYINIFGEIGGIKKSYTMQNLYGYIVSSDEGTLSKSPRLKMITALSSDSRGEEIFELAEYVTVDGKKYHGDEVENAIVSNNGTQRVPVVYTLNSYGKVTGLDTPYYDSGREGQNTLTRRSFSAKFDKFIQVARPKGYKNLLGQRYYVPENGLVVITPDNESDIRRMSYIPSKAVTAGSGYSSASISVYSMGGTTAMCPIVVWADNQADEESADYEKELYMVEDIRSEVNSDDSEAMVVSLRLGNKITDYFISTKTSVVAAEELKVGDIVRASFDAYGEINGMEIMFSSESPDKYVGKVYVHNTKGDAGAQITLMAHEFRVAVGKIKSVEYDSVTQKYYVTYFLSDESDTECASFISSAQKCSPGRGGIEISDADAANIKTYDDVGDNADIIVVRYQFCVPITEYFISR